MKILTLLFNILGFALLPWMLLLACNTDSGPDAFEITLTNPVTLDSTVARLEASLEYGQKQAKLFSGDRSNPQFSGPWVVVLSDFDAESETLNLKLKGISKQGNAVMDLSIRYRKVGKKLVADSTLQFWADTLTTRVSSLPLQLQWIALPAEAGLHPAFESSAPNVAKVSDSGRVSLVAQGDANVVLYLPGATLRDTLQLHVLPQGEVIVPGDTTGTLPVEVLPDSIRLFADSLEIGLSLESFPLSWTLYPQKFKGDVACKSLNPGIVAMKGKDALVPIAVGEVQIVCEIVDHPKSDTLKLKVSQAATESPLDSIRILTDSLAMKLGDPAIQLGYALYPVNAKAQVIWSTQSSAINLGNEGLVSAREPGKGLIRVLAVGSKVVGDSIPFTISDTAQRALWFSDTLTLRLKGGEAATIRLEDSVFNPSHAPLSFSYTGGDARIALQAGLFRFTAGNRDSGEFYARVSMRQGDWVSQVTLHVKVEPLLFNLRIDALNGSVAVLPSRAAFYLGDTVTLTATPNTGYAFSGWSGALTGTLNPQKWVVTGNANVTAIFTLTTVSPCTEVVSGESLQAKLNQAYAAPSRPQILCPAASGRFNGNAIQVLGKVQLQLN